jgi:hypothetical protein
MKKIIISAVVFSLLGASVAYGASKVFEIKSYDFIGQVQTQQRGSIFIYKFVDEKNTCYIAEQAFATGGANSSISCVK